MWNNIGATMHCTRQELLDLRGISAGNRLCSNVNVRIDSLGVGFTVLESSPVPTWIYIVRCKRLAKQLGLNGNNLTSFPVNNNSNQHKCFEYCKMRVWNKVIACMCCA